MLTTKRLDAPLLRESAELTTTRLRWWEFVEDRRIHCGPPTIGHHLPANFDFPETGFIPCRHWIAPEHRECGRWVFLYAVRGGGIVVAEIFSLDEKDAMKNLITPAAMLRYLNIFPSR